MSKNKKQLSIQTQLEVSLSPSVGIELITPEIAEELLKKNPKNRPLKEDATRRYRREMERGKWQFNGESIKVCEDGSLMDGQHRLKAIIEFGAPQELVVVRNLQRKAFSTIDIGKKRSVQDMLAINGYQYYTQLSSAAKIIFMYNGTKEIGQSSFKAARSYTIDDILELIESDENLYKDTLYALLNYRTLWATIGGSVTGALFYLFAQRDRELALEMFSLLNSRAIGNPDSVLLKCSNLLIKEHMERKVRRSSDTGYRISLLVRTWNYMRDGLWDERLVQDYSLPIQIIK